MKRNRSLLVTAIILCAFFWAISGLAILVAEKSNCGIDFLFSSKCDYLGFYLYRVLWFVCFGGQILALLAAFISIAMVIGKLILIIMSRLTRGR